MELRLFDLSEMQFHPRAAVVPRAILSANEVSRVILSLGLGVVAIH